MATKHKVSAPVPAGSSTQAVVLTAVSTEQGPQPPAVIEVPVGSAGFYTGARPSETAEQYADRLGTAADTFQDLGWLLGTKPVA